MVVRNKIKNSVLIVLIVLLVFSLFSLVFAQDTGEVEIDWQNEDDFYANFADNPASAFENNPDLAWGTLSTDYSLYNLDYDIIEAAYNNDPGKFGQFVNDNPDVLDLEYKNYEADESSYRARELFKEGSLNDVSMLNDNPDAKMIFLESEYGITLENMDVLVSKYERVYKVDEFGLEVLDDEGQPILIGERVTTSVTKTRRVYGEDDRPIHDNEGEYVREDYVDERATFTISDFPGAKIDKNGFLILDKDLCNDCKITASDDVHLLRDKNGEIEYYDSKPVIVLSNGHINAKSDVSNSKIVAQDDSSIEIYSDNKDDYVELKGSFEVSFNNDGTIISGETITTRYGTSDSLVYSEGFLLKQGGIFIPRGSEGRDFVLIDNAVIDTRGAIYSINSHQSQESEVHYRPVLNRDNGFSCDESITCIIEFFGNNPESLDYKGDLIISNLKNVDINVDSTARFNSVQVDDVVDGEFSFRSMQLTPTAGTGLSTSVKSIVTVNSETGDVSFSGSLADTNSGRFDVVSKKDSSCTGEDCIMTMQHWSSAKIQRNDKGEPSPGSYFPNDGSSFVTCIIGADCESRLAESFGKVIRSGDQEPNTLVIVAGDNALTAKNLESLCRSSGGCYILNSRDVPAYTNTDHLVITGHHYEGDTFAWRDPPGVDGHNPIDVLHFNSPSNGQVFDHLPKGDVETVSFSACNTVKFTDREYTGYGDQFRSLGIPVNDEDESVPEGTVDPTFYALENQYRGSLRSVAGYHVKAPLHDYGLKPADETTIGGRGGAVKRARIDRIGDTGNDYRFTYDGDTYQDVFIPSEEGETFVESYTDVVGEDGFTGYEG